MRHALLLLSHSAAFAAGVLLALGTSCHVNVRLS